MKIKSGKNKHEVRVPPSQKGEVRPKKKKSLESKSTALVVASEGLPKVKKSELKSFFGKQAPEILRALEMNDNDGALTLIKKRLLQTTVRLIPYAENIVQSSQSQKGIYQFTSLVNQIRELMTDIQADQDRRYIAQSLVREVLQPAFMEMAQTIITDHHAFRKASEDMLDPKYTQKFSADLQKLAKDFAGKMMEVYKDVERKTYEHLKN